MKFKFELMNDISETGDTDSISITHNMRSASDSLDTLLLTVKRFLNLTGFRWEVLHAYIPITPYESHLTGLQATIDDSEIQRRISGYEPEDDDYDDEEDYEGTAPDPSIDKFIEAQSQNPDALKKFMSTIQKDSSTAKRVFQLYLEDIMYE